MPAAAAGTPILPLAVRPMLAQAADGPLASSDYAYEVKWDGMRVLLGLDGDRVSIRTRNDIEAFPRFPELACLRELITPSRAILDGEIVRMVDGAPSFGALQSRIHLSNPLEIERGAVEAPILLIVFDLLRIGDEWLMGRRWQERRERLESVVRQGAAVQISPVFDDGMELWKIIDNLRLEGVMAKLRSAPYTPGKRSPSWLKIKRLHTCDVVVGGWTEGTGHRAGMGALVLGVYIGDRLYPIGKVGTGFDDLMLGEMLRSLPKLETKECPFEPRPVTDAVTHWARPELVCEIRCLGLGSDGNIRFPVFVRWRPDKLPRDCAMGA